MTSFGWKRKHGEKVCSSASFAFEQNAKQEDDVAEINSGEIDWLSLAPKRRNIQLEDAHSKSERLKKEGEVLAESDRYWEALKKWEEALQLTPENEDLYEMKAQAYISLNEVHPAISAATKAVEIKPMWWVAHQTLGRAHLNLGEVRIALKCFSRAVHLNPADGDLWTEDFQWAHTLVKRKEKLKEQTENIENESEKNKIIELNDDETSQSLLPVIGKQGNLDTNLLHLGTATNSNNKTASKSTDLKHLPANYVFMRD